MRVVRLPSRRERRPSRGLRVAFFAAAVVAATGGVSAALPAQSDALSLTEVLELQRRGVSAHQILRNVRQYCIAFSIGDSVERALAASSADSILVTGLRQACVIKDTPPLPPGVLLDDDFKSSAGFASADRLCIARREARGMRVENRRRDSGCAVAVPFDVPRHDIRIELTVAEVKGEPRGVVAIGFGKDSASGDQYSFAMMTDGDVELGETIRGRFRQLRYERRIGPIRADPSSERRMAVELRGSSIDLYVNDERVMTYATDRPLANGLALGLGPRSTVLFARLVVKRTGTVASTP